MKLVKVWDLPVRLFHWLLVIAIIGLFVTSELGGNWMEWHRRLGFTVLGLILFRLVWGVLGSTYARFGQFVRGPASVIDYMRSLRKPDAKHYLGHNPMGALSVVAILAVIGFQAISGLFADDDILMRGPYANAVAKEVSEWFSKMHEWNSKVLIGLVIMHLAAIAFYYFVKRENLIKPMVTGEKSLIGGHFEGISPETARPVWVFWLVALLVSGVTYLIVARPFW